MIYLPTLHSFAMNNIFTGSEGNLRFRIVPKVAKLPNSKEVDMENSSIEAEYWYGVLCYEKSTIEGRCRRRARHTPGPAFSPEICAPGSRDNRPH